MILLKAKYRGDDEKIYNECVNDCNFLFTYYTDIFNKIRKDEIDIGILNKFLDVLRRIEDGELDQHEGSFMVGTILKDIYVDSALKKAEKLDANFEKEKVEPFPYSEVNLSSLPNFLIKSVTIYNPSPDPFGLSLDGII